MSNPGGTTESAPTHVSGSDQGRRTLVCALCRTNKEGGPRFPMSSRGPPILTLHSPLRAAGHEAGETSSDPLTQKVPPLPPPTPPHGSPPSPRHASQQERTPTSCLTGASTASHLLSPRCAGALPAQREAPRSPLPPAAPASLGTPVEATGRGHPLLSPHRIGAADRCCRSVLWSGVPSSRYTKLGVD